jgi:hypothetical protein
VTCGVGAHATNQVSLRSVLPQKLLAGGVRALAVVVTHCQRAALLLRLTLRRPHYEDKCRPVGAGLVELARRTVPKGCVEHRARHTVKYGRSASSRIAGDVRRRPTALVFDNYFYFRHRFFER